MSVVLDTSAICSVLDDTDPNHIRGVDALTDLAKTPVDLRITNYAVAETLSLTSRRYGMTIARNAQTMISRCEILWTSPAEHVEAAQHFVSSGRGLSFVDCATIAVMSTRGLTDIFAFDRDFSRAGLNVIPR